MSTAKQSILLRDIKRLCKITSVFSHAYWKSNLTIDNLREISAELRRYYKINVLLETEEDSIIVVVEIDRSCLPCNVVAIQFRSIPYKKGTKEYDMMMKIKYDLSAQNELAGANNNVLLLD